MLRKMIEQRVGHSIDDRTFKRALNAADMVAKFRLEYGLFTKIDDLMLAMCAVVG